MELGIMKEFSSGKEELRSNIWEVAREEFRTRSCWIRNNDEIISISVIRTKH